MVPSLSLFAVKGEGPAFGRAFFLLCFYFIELSETKMPVLAGLFFGLQVIYFELFRDFWVMIFEREGLDMRLWRIFEGLDWLGHRVWISK